MIDLQYGIFLDDAEQHQNAEGRVKVQRVARGPEGEQRKRHGQRQREQNREGMNRAFVLRSEDHVHENNRQEHRPDEFVIGAGQLAPASGNGGRVPGRKVHLPYGPMQGFQAIAERKSRRDLGAQACLALAVEAVDARSAAGGFNLYQVVEPDQAGAPPGHIKPRDGVDTIAITRRQPQLHIVFFIDAGVMKAGHFLVAADHQAERGGDMLRIHIEIRRAFAVDDDPQLRPVEFKRRVGVDDAQISGTNTQFFAVVGESHQIRPAQDKIDIPVAAADVERRQIAHRGAQIGKLCEPAADLLHDIALRSAPESRPGLPVEGLAPQAPERKYSLVVGRDAHVATARAHAADKSPARVAEHQAHQRDSPQLGFHGAHDIVHSCETGSLRRGEVEIEFRLIHIAGDVLLAHEVIKGHRREHHEGGQCHDDQAMSHRPPQHSFVAPVNPGVETSPGSGLMLVAASGCILGTKHARAHHRSEREGNQQADQNCHRRGNSELVEKPARDAGHEGNRNKDYDQADGSRHHRQPDLGGGRARRLKRVHLLFLDEAEDVFQDNDGVIDDDTDHQHKSEHGHAVERKIERPHHAEGGHDRRRNRDGGNDGGSPTAHERQHDQSCQDAAQNQVDGDFMERGVDITRLIANDLDLHVRRNLTLDPGKIFFHRFDNRDGIGA